MEVPADYLEWVNLPQTQAEEEAVRTSIRRGRPFGDAAWQRRTVEKLGLQSSLNPTHRPRRKPAPEKGG